MKSYYSKFVDKFFSGIDERTLHLGKRSGDDRRLMDDRRLYFDENFLQHPEDRRLSGNGRRLTEERRKRWVRMSQWRSRHA